MAAPPRAIEAAAPAAMTRCECAELPFEEVVRRLERGTTLEELGRRTGCGRTCTACLPDLDAFLASRRSPRR